MRTTSIALVAMIVCTAIAAAGADDAPPTVLVEAEAFDDLGGWVNDSQFMDQMGSPFLLAHGLGRPVDDATTTVEFPAAGRYRVLVRTRDWVAPWNAPGSPGRFQVLVDGEPLPVVFGTEGAEWHWQDGGLVEVAADNVTVGLRDLTGFEGRCDAVLFTLDHGLTPPNAGAELAAFRRRLLGMPEAPEEVGPFDLVVVGGGIAGTCAAVSAARLDLEVALIQDRPVLGGNNSSEVRVWLQGARNVAPYPRVGDVVAELEQERSAHYGPENTADLYEDDRKLALVRAEENVALMLNWRANGVEWESGFDHHPFRKSETIRDWNFRAMYGAWDCLKNVDKVYPNHKLNWAASVAGKRESRRLLGDLVLTAEDLTSGRRYPDGCVPTGWKIDLHLPDPRYLDGFEGDGFIAKAHYTDYPRPYWVPYRCLYSRNVDNLFMAGRDVSVTHEALGAVRVMRTGGCMGEIVGMAASLCRKHDVDPRAVYRGHLDRLKQLMRDGPGKPVAPPPELEDVGANLAREAAVATSGDRDPAASPPELVNDGQADWRRNELRWLSHAQVPNWVEFRWEEPVTIAGARVTSGYCQGGTVGAPIESFVLQRLDGGAWRDVTATDTIGNAATDWHRRFEPVTATAMRLLVRRTPIRVSRIWEVELYAPAE